MREQAYGYIRVSSRKQLDGDGPERQRAKILTLCATQDIELLQFWTDAEKGKNELRDREQMELMRVAIIERGIKTVIVEGPHRLARDLIVSEGILFTFRQMGVKVLSAEGAGMDLTKGSDTDDPMQQAVRQIMAVIAQLEKNMLVLKMRAARNRIRAEGKGCEGEPAYGEVRKNEKRPPTPEELKRQKYEQAIIEKIFSLRRAGMSYGKIADYLNGAMKNGRDLYVPRRGKEWGKSWIRAMIVRMERLGKAPKVQLMSISAAELPPETRTA